jgi:glycosyltransferase involved in cell wall biosynthesis
MSRRVKRVDIFLKAAEYALQKRRDLKFIVFGEGELKGELIRMTEEAGIQDHVIFVGQNTSRHKVLSSIDIGILSSDSEAFSNAIMEYMASGLPVIATAVGGNLELVEHNFTGYLTKPGDAAEIGEKILILAGDIHKREEFGKNGRKRVEKYNWDKIIERVMEYYEERVIS